MVREQTVRVRVAARAELADGVVGLELEPVEGLAGLPEWEPGAHVDLVAPHGLVRQYSLCGVADRSARWRVAVLRVADGRGGSAWVHDRLAEGAELDARGPRNHFTLEDAPSYLFVAGGIGITPILPMLREVEARGVPWRLVYGGRRRGTMAFLDELASYGDRVEVRPEDECGLLDLPAVLGAVVPGRRVYCCGPEPLLAAVEAAVRDRPGETLHVERFAPRPEASAAGAEFEVEVASTGERVKVGADESIIDALGRAGVEVEFSCREGTCGTCETTVLAGVPEHRDSVLTDDERAENSCLMICVGRCLEGPLVLDL